MTLLSPPTQEDSLATWIDWMQHWHPVGIDLGLERVKQVYKHSRFRGAESAIPSVIVGGTNGKGSVTAYLAAICQASGLSAGVYRSPHLLRYNERFIINGVPASDEEIIGAFAAVVERARSLKITLSSFEIMTLAAVELFALHHVDIAILEVGLGGRLDAVNVVDPIVSVVTNIGIDHIDWLGDNREIIGWEKAHIFRENRPAIVGDHQAPDSLQQYAREIAAQLALIDRDFSLREANSTPPTVDFFITTHDQGNTPLWQGLTLPGIPGKYQRSNAACALAAVAALTETLLPLSDQITCETVSVGLAKAFLPGRLQRISSLGQQWLIDVGHNADAAEALAAYLREIMGDQKVPAIFGVMADKDIEAIIRSMSEVISIWHVIDLPIDRAATADQIADKIVSVVPDAVVVKYSNAVEAIGSLQQGRQQNTITNKNEINTVVFGSFHTVAEVLPELDQQ